MIECPKPGIYKNVPEAEYHQWDAFNASTAKTLLKHTPKRAYYERMNPKDPSPAMIWGTEAHTFLLEPETVNGRYMPPLGIQKRSKADRETWAKYLADNAGKELMDATRMQAHYDMSHEMHTRDDWREIWKNRIAVEVCVVWLDDETGLLMKCRIDMISRYLGGSVVIDYKTCADASAWKFGKDCHEFGYDVQAAHYLAAADSIAPGDDRAFVLAAQEKTPPYDAMLHTLDPASMESGRIRWRRAVRTWAACVEDDDYPGYRHGIGEISMPNYAIDLSEGVF